MSMSLLQRCYPMKKPLLFGIVLSFLSLPAFAAPMVVASIKPVHSLVAAIMQGVGEPSLIVEGAGSPHSFNLKPSLADKIAKADLIFWVGPNLETFLVKPLANLGKPDRAIALIETEKLVLHDFREADDFAGHGEEHNEAGHEEKTDDGHHHDGGVDPHIWLDLDNAMLMATRIETALSQTDPDNAALYQRNATALHAQLGAMKSRIAARLAALKQQRFVVFHDAYQYFEHQFGLSADQALTLNTDIKPGAAHLASIQHHIKEDGIGCVFIEPQFNPDIAKLVIEGSNAKIHSLDPLGAAMKDGPALYPALIEAMAEAFSTCLTH